MDCDENSIETKQDSNRFPNWKLFIRNLPTFLPVCFLHAWQLAWMTAVYSLPPSKSTPDQYPSPICSSYILLLFWARCMSAFHCFYLWFFCGETLWVFFFNFFFFVSLEPSELYCCRTEMLWSLSSMISWIGRKIPKLCRLHIHWHF